MRKLLVSLLFLCGVSMPVFATGPSHIDIEIIPLAMNAEGWILVKSRIAANPTGAAGQTRVSYHLTVYDRFRILFDQEYKTVIPVEGQEKQVQREVMGGDTDHRGLHMEANHYLVKYIRAEYGFTQYKRIPKQEEQVSFDKFRMMFGMTGLKQITAGGYLSAGYPSDSITILYQRGDFALIQNSMDPDGVMQGDFFGIPIPYHSSKRQPSIPYDHYKIQGLIFK